MLAQQPNLISHPDGQAPGHIPDINDNNDNDVMIIIMMMMMMMMMMMTTIIMMMMMIMMIMIMMMMIIIMTTTTTTTIIIIIIIIKALKGTIRDFCNLLTAPRTVSNTYAQVARAQPCSNHVQHIERFNTSTHQYTYLAGQCVRHILTHQGTVCYAHKKEYVSVFCSKVSASTADSIPAFPVDLFLGRVKMFPVDGIFSFGVNMGSDSIRPKTLSDENINRAGRSSSGENFFSR